MQTVEQQSKAPLQASGVMNGAVNEVEAALPESPDGALPLFRYTMVQGKTDRNVNAVWSTPPEEFIQRMLDEGPTVGPKEGTGFIPAIFKRGTTRAKANVESVTAVVLDVDGIGPDKAPANPDEILAKLPFKGVAYTSHSNTPANPRFRIILPLQEPVTPSQFERLWAWVAHRVDGACDPACKNPDRLYYWPRASKEAIEKRWPWVRALPGERLLRFEDVPADFVGSHGAQHARVPGFRSTHPSDLVRSSGPETPTDWQSILQQLMGLRFWNWAETHPRDVSYEIWRGIATNLAALALDGACEAEEACRRAFHEVSAADKHRYDQGYCDLTFNRALESAANAGPMTWGHLVDCGLPDELAEQEGTSPLGTARRLARAAASKRAAGSDPATPDEVPRQDVAGSPDPNRFLYDAAMDRWIIANEKGEWLEENYTTSGLKRLLRPLLPIEKNENSEPSDPLPAFLDRIRPFAARRPFYDSRDSLVELHGVTYFNSYRPTTLKAVPGQWDNIRAVLLNLVDGDLEGLEWLLDWVAGPLQSLERDGQPQKRLTAPVFYGAHGTGKGLFAASLLEMYGAANFATIGQTQLDSRFSGPEEGRLMVFANEIMSSTNRTQETANKLKALVTDKIVPVERKGQTARNVVNHANYFFASNDQRPVLIEGGDRRFVAFETRRKLDEAVGQAVLADLEGPLVEVAAFYEHLLSRQVRYKPGELYETLARRRLMEMSLPPATLFCQEIKELGWQSQADAWVRGAGPYEVRTPMVVKNGAPVVETQVLHEVYSDWLKHRYPGRTAGGDLSGALKAVLGASTKKMRIGKHPKNVWVGMPMDAPDVEPDGQDEAGPSDYKDTI